MTEPTEEENAPRELPDIQADLAALQPLLEAPLPLPVLSEEDRLRVERDIRLFGHAYVQYGRLDAMRINPSCVTIHQIPFDV